MKHLDIERTDVANEELSVATTIAENAGVSDEQVANLLTEIKKQIAEQDTCNKRRSTTNCRRTISKT